MTSFSISVSLMSGRSVQIHTSTERPLQDVREQAQKALQIHMRGVLQNLGRNLGELGISHVAVARNVP